MLGGRTKRSGLGLRTGASTRAPALAMLTLLLSACAGLDLPFRKTPDTAPAVHDTVTHADATAAAPHPDTVDTTPTAPRPPDLWRRLAIEIRMSLGASPGVEAALREYAANPGFVMAAVERAAPYLHFVLSEIERRGLPYEIALIPVVESGYAPRATSPDGAAGLWQIMAVTGRRLGLQQSRWYDGRRDVVDSTRAALDYLEKLRDRFRGDWLLAFAAFNCGEGTVERAMERNRRAGLGTDFAALELPRETERYVPRLLALTEIFAHPEKHGLALPVLPDAPWFDSVDVGAPLDLERVRDWAGMDEDAFDALNPGFRTRFTAPGNPTRVLVPVGRADAVRTALAALTPEDRVAPRTHVVAAGETLSHIAARSGVSVAALRQTNGLRGHRIRAGQRLLLPAPGTPAAQVDATPEAGSGGVHVIAPGDTFWDIARVYGTTPEALAAANGLGVTATLRPGRELRLPTGRPAQPGTPRIHYEVRQGDSLWTISKRFKVTVEDLRRWNGLTGRRYLRPGQKLVVHVPPGSGVAQEI